MIALSPGRPDADFIAFAGSRMDRADHVRSDPQAIAALAARGARVLRLEGLEPEISAEGRLGWDALPGDDGRERIFLGIEDGTAHFVDIPEVSAAEIPLFRPANWNVMAMLEAGDLAAYGGARSLVSWHVRHRFCSVCGAPSLLAKGGWQRTCTNPACGAAHFPRVDPVTIMTVEHEGRLLLGRQPRFPQGRYSALAGFVEPGETLEEAVARETFEEAGVRVRDIAYIASQPWPFPSSLMIACHAHADDPAITIDETELEDARWFTRAEVADAIAAVARGEQGAAFGAPPRHAVAHVLLDWWLQRG